MQNLEIKARYSNQRRAWRLAHERLQAEDAGVLVQTDTYFNVRQGRLKLRVIRPASSAANGTEPHYELIFYHRPNQGSPKASSYDILPVENGPKALAIFTASLGVKAVVHKSRRVFLKDNLRVHLDRVRGLGAFLEFELIVSAGHPLPECRGQMDQLLALFEIADADLVPVSYLDLLLRKDSEA